MSNEIALRVLDLAEELGALKYGDFTLSNFGGQEQLLLRWPD